MRRPPLPVRAPGLGVQLVALSLALTLLAGGLVGAILTAQSRAALHDEVLTDHLAAVDLITAYTAEFVENAESDAQELATRPALVQATIDGNWDAVSSELERWLPFHSHADSVAVYSLDGVQRASGLADKRLVRVFSATDRDWFTAVVATGAPFRGQARKSIATNQAVVGYAVPLLDEHGALRAVLSAPISLRLLADTLLRVHPGTDARITIDDYEQHVILAHVNPERMLRPQSGVNAATARLDRGEHAVMDTINSEGEAHLAAFGPVPGLPWGVMITQPSKVAFAPITAMLRTALGVVAGVLLLAGVLGGLLALRIAGPLRRLRAAAEAMATGDLDQRTGIAGRDEVGELARAFDHMAARLRGTIGQLEQREAELAHRAYHDALTGLPNRTAFHDQLRQALTRQASDDAGLAVLFLDLDNFKLVNDGLGHAVGDRLLVEVAARLRACLAPASGAAGQARATVARLSGDEFTVLLEGAAGARAALDLAEHVAERLRAPLVLDGHEVGVAASVGVALAAPGDGLAPGELLRRADVALYAAKRGGKARCVLFEPCLDDGTMRRLQLAADLRHALDRGELDVHYQPLVRLADGAVHELEALVRWRHPRLGSVSPSEFVPLAEETGLIVPIGRWVLDEACRQVSAWQALSPDGEPLLVNVNLSARQLQHPDLLADVRRSLAASGLDPSCLRLEITESVAVAETESAAALLGALRAMGVGLAIDDFGAGTSALGYLERFPVDTLKIDRSFVERLGREPRATALVRAVVAFARSLGLSVTGEGVETAEQMAGLLALGCDRGQGYLFARPAPASEVPALLGGAAAIPRAA